MYMLVPILISVFLISVISLVGALALSLKEKILDKLLFVLIAVAAGTMLGVAFLDLIPEAVEKGGPNVFLYVLSGILAFFVLERFIFWHHCHDGKCDVHAFSYLNLVGDGVHNFLDGMVIAAAYFVSIPLGVATTIAIALHEIPQEVGDFAILIYGGFGRKKALFYNFLSALAAFVGVAVAYVFSSSEGFFTFVLAFAAGGFIYIASADIMPELQKEREFRKSLLQLLCLIGGIVLMWVIIHLFD
ncbi:ZIP family metal transporter [archaeon]|nr:ZIP family metal transporter [archaeon]